jgi:preprotein translocase subunit SecD
VVLDDQIRSVATIQSRIDDSGRITGQGGEVEAQDLSLVLRAGALPARIEYLEERTVGPSLGADSIRQGSIAGLAGLAVVVAIMLFYYRRAGVNAVAALILNAVILIAALGYFGAVLTLPGIAGIILTIGMAVDSNVLIFERIKEELRAGKAIPAAIDTGFNKAFLTIIDTHVTTVVSCAFLFMFGTGPVRGFAITLVIGLMANVFTAIFVSKTLFEFSLARNRRMAALSI